MGRATDVRFREPRRWDGVAAAPRVRSGLLALLMGLVALAWLCGRSASAAPGQVVTNWAIAFSDDGVAVSNRVEIPLWVGFPDVPLDYWAYDEIMECFVADVVDGYADGLYRPERPVSRGQMAVYISRAMAGGDRYVPEADPEPTFPDVDTDHWTYRYVEYTVSHHVVSGYSDGNYHPDWELTRAQMAVYIARARGWVGLWDDMDTAPDLFPDVPAGFWSGSAIEACVAHDVVVGYPDGLYRPTRSVTRAQMAVYIARAFQLTD